MSGFFAFFLLELGLKFNISIDTDKYLQRFKTRAPVDRFPPSQSLLSLPIVRKTILVLLLVALSMAFSVVLTTEVLTFDFSAKGYETAAQLFKAPIAIALLAIPLLALLASNHRSVQTSRQMSLTTNQIDLATGQNLFANYYKHVEEFSKWCDHIEGTGAVKSKRKLHKEMFPNARSGSFSLSSDVVTGFTAHAKALCNLFVAFSGPKDGRLHLPIIASAQENFAKRYWLSTIPHEAGSFKFEMEGASVMLPPTGVQGFLNEHLKLIRAFDELLSFDSDYESSDFVVALLEVDTRRIPEDPNKFRNYDFNALRGIGARS